MADTPSPRLTNANSTDPFEDMTSIQTAAAQKHIRTVWWNELCRSMHNKLVHRTGVFTELPFDKDGMVDLHNQVHWKIIMGLGKIYHAIRYEQKEDVNQFHVRFVVHFFKNKEDQVLLHSFRWVDGKRTQGLRFRAPLSGWLDTEQLDEWNEQQALHAAQKNVKPEQSAAAVQATTMGTTTTTDDSPVVNNAVTHTEGGATMLSATQETTPADKDDITHFMMSGNEPASNTSRKRARSTISEDELTTTKATKNTKFEGDLKAQDPSVDDQQANGASSDQDEVSDKFNRMSVASGTTISGDQPDVEESATTSAMETTSTAPTVEESAAFQENVLDEEFEVVDKPVEENELDDFVMVRDEELLEEPVVADKPVEEPITDDYVMACDEELLEEPEMAEKPAEEPVANEAFEMVNKPTAPNRIDEEDAIEYDDIHSILEEAGEAALTFPMEASRKPKGWRKWFIRA